MTRTPRHDNSFVKKDSWIGWIKSAFWRQKLNESSNGPLQPLKNQSYHVDNRGAKHCSISYDKKDISRKKILKEKDIVDKLKSESDNRRAWASDRRKKDESSKYQRSRFKQKPTKEATQSVNSEQNDQVKMLSKGNAIINDDKLLTKDKFENKRDGLSKNKEIKTALTTKQSVFQNKRKKESKIKASEENTSDVSNIINKTKGTLAGKYFKSLKSSLISMKVIDSAKENSKCEQHELKKKIKPSLKEEKNEKGNEFRTKIPENIATKRIHHDRNINIKSIPIPKKRKNALNNFYENKSVDDKFRTFHKKGGKSRNDKVKMIKSQNVNKNIQVKGSDRVKNDSASGDGYTTLMRQIHLYDEALDSSVSNFNTTHVSEPTCSCGCMKLHNIPVTTSTPQYRIDSSTSCSSIEYLRSYSGNLVMSANGKKPLLSDFIKYLPSL